MEPELHPAESRGYRELYAFSREVIEHWAALASALGSSSPPGEALGKGVRATLELVSELEPLTASYDLYGKPAAQGVGLQIARQRSAVRDRFLERGQALRFAVEDIVHLCVLLGYLGQVAQSRDDEGMVDFCARWGGKLRRHESAVRKAAAQLGSDPDAAIEPCTHRHSGARLRARATPSARQASGSTAGPPSAAEGYKNHARAVGLVVAVRNLGHNGRMGGRRSSTVAAVTLVALGAAGGASAVGGSDDGAHASAAKRAADAAQRPVARAAVLSANRRNVGRVRYMRVRIRSSKPASIRIFGVARRPVRGARAYRVTTTGRVHMRRRGARVVRLRLSRTGKRLLGGCQTLTVRPGGKVRARGARRGRRLRVSSRRLPAVGPRCRLVPGGGGLGAPPESPRPLGAIDTANADRCDFLDESLCLYPFPNDHYTRADTTTPTKRRLNLNSASVPKNRAGKPIDPTDQNRADGFSPGNLIVTKVPGLDNPEALRRTGAVPITDMARAFDPDQPVVVINARTGARHLVWAEIDSNPKDPRDVTLMIRPGENFEEGERYIVALRRMRDANGAIIAPREEFRAYRDDLKTKDPALESRRAHFEDLFATLARSGIGRRDLYLTWDFTVASAQSLAGRMLHIRDDAFKALGDTNLSDLKVQGSSPPFQVTKVEDFTPADDARIARRVEGQVVVPCYLDLPGCPTGSRFQIGADGKPVRNPANFAAAGFICNIPRSAAAGQPARPSLYGHGLLGSADQVNASKLSALGNDYGVMFCATDWAGFAEQDLPTVATILQDLSEFPKLVDRSQQGFLNFLYLGRAMVHPQGFASHAAFQFGGKSAIDTQRLFYNGGSQGGILGGGLTAVAPDFDRAALGVPGMNYSTLLQRSVDFVPYAEGDLGFGDTEAGLYDSYPNELERPLVLSMTQLLWDRGEANGYAHHMTTDPYPNTPPHEILLHEAFGDHQVANITTEVMARTSGARLRTPALDPGRSLDAQPFFDIPAIGSYPFGGSALVVWDVGPLRTENGKVKGTPPPPPRNVPNSEGVDPHGPDASETADGQRQVAEFLKVNGKVVSVCNSGPCYLDGWTGPGGP